MSPITHSNMNFLIFLTCPKKKRIRLLSDDEYHPTAPGKKGKKKKRYVSSDEEDSSEEFSEEEEEEDEELVWSESVGDELEENEVESGEEYQPAGRNARRAAALKSRRLLF